MSKIDFVFLIGCVLAKQNIAAAIKAKKSRMTNDDMEMERSSNLLLRAVWSATGMNMIAGTLSGFAGVLVGHPFDTIKV